jgi:hypothetical protein
MYQIRKYFSSVSGNSHRGLAGTLLAEKIENLSQKAVFAESAAQAPTSKTIRRGGPLWPDTA